MTADYFSVPRRLRLGHSRELMPSPIFMGLFQRIAKPAKSRLQGMFSNSFFRCEYLGNRKLPTP